MKANRIIVILALLLPIAARSQNLALPGASIAAITCNAANHGKSITITDPESDIDCTGTGTGFFPHDCICYWDGATGVFVPDIQSTDGTLTLIGADPSIIFDSEIATDTDWWLGVQEDAGGDDDDTFEIGDGLTPGTNTFLTIETNGDIGIGITLPQTDLHVQESTTDNVPTIEVEQLSTGDTALQFSLPGDSYAMGVDNDDSDTFKISYASGAGTATLGTNDRIFITPSGNVGIGGSPITTLDVKSVSSAQLRVINSGTAQVNSILDANPATADANIGTLSGRWAGTVIGSIRFRSGTDTVNKDEGYIVFENISGGSSAEVLRIGTATDHGAMFSQNVEFGAHITTANTSPTAGTCGTSPSIIGTDISGKVTIGTGGPTSCIVTFGVAYSNAPPCVASFDITLGTSQAVVSTTTTLTVGDGSTDLSLRIFSYICIQ